MTCRNKPQILINGKREQLGTVPAFWGYISFALHKDGSVEYAQVIGG